VAVLGRTSRANWKTTTIEGLIYILYPLLGLPLAFPPRLVEFFVIIVPVKHAPPSLLRGSPVRLDFLFSLRHDSVSSSYLFCFPSSSRPHLNNSHAHAKDLIFLPFPSHRATPAVVYSLFTVPSFPLLSLLALTNHGLLYLLLCNLAFVFFTLYQYVFLSLLGSDLRVPFTIFFFSL